MKNFKEWLSDYLRYFMLALVLVLVFALVFILVKVFRKDDGKAGDSKNQQIQILTEEGQTSKKETESETEPATEKATESETETKETETETGETKAGAVSGENGADRDRENDKAVPNSSNAAENGETAVQQNAGETERTGEDRTTAQSETSAVIETEPQTEPVPQTEPEPVYRSLVQACNLRSGPGYDYEVVSVLPEGTVVEYRGIVEGWAEVQIDGMIGYMGKQFLGY